MEKNMETVVIASAARTPIASFQGALASLSAPRLGAIAVKEATKKAGVNLNEIEDCIMGEVLTAGVGQAPARQTALYAGLPYSVQCMTINKVCGSGLKAIMLAADSIALGHTKISVAGGQENMTLAPHLLENSRIGYRMGHSQITDSMIKDGLWDPYSQWHMGNAAELCVKEKQFTRQQQDDFTIESYKKAQKAQAEGWFRNEIAPVELQDKKKGAYFFDTDEEPSKTQFDKIAGLKPAFDKNGTITPANASKISDGAAAVVLMSETICREKKLTPLAKIISYATFAQEPNWFTTAPVGAIKAALKKAKLNIADIDFWEINEAFAVVTMTAIKELEIPVDRVNPHGGAVALGHPIGASGCRLITTLAYALKTHNKKYGLATLCIGGGEAVAMIIERI